MTRPSNRRVLLAALAAAAAVFAAVVVRSTRGPDVVWCPVDSVGGVFSFRAAPDGVELPHGATMSDPDAAWAYYYPAPNAWMDLLVRVGWHDASTSDFIATGRTTTTSTGRWIEMRRCDEGELLAAIDGGSVK